jgi:hypothetical protein
MPIGDFKLLNELAGNGDFVGRVTYAMESKAAGIAQETTAGVAIPWRKDLAGRVLDNPLEEAANFARVLVTQNPIATLDLTDPLNQAEVTDANITSAMSDTLWDGYAEKNYRR